MPALPPPRLRGVSPPHPQVHWCPLILSPPPPRLTGVPVPSQVHWCPGPPSLVPSTPPSQAHWRPCPLSPSASPALRVSHLPSSPAPTGGWGPWQPPGSRAPKGAGVHLAKTSRSASGGHLSSPKRPRAADQATVCPRSGPKRGPRQDRLPRQPIDLSKVSRGARPAPSGVQRSTPKCPVHANTCQHRAPFQVPGRPWG